MASKAFFTCQKIYKNKVASVSSHVTTVISPSLLLRLGRARWFSCSASLYVWTEIWWTQMVYFGPCWGREVILCAASWWNGPLSDSPSFWRLWWASLSGWKPHTSPHTWHSGRLCNCSPVQSQWRYNLCSGHLAVWEDRKVSCVTPGQKLIHLYIKLNSWNKWLYTVSKNVSANSLK